MARIYIQSKHGHTQYMEHTQWDQYTDTMNGDQVVRLTEQEWMAPVETRKCLNLSMDHSIQNFRRRRGLDPMTGDLVNV